MYIHVNDTEEHIRIIAYDETIVRKYSLFVQHILDLLGGEFSIHTINTEIKLRRRLFSFKSFLSCASGATRHRILKVKYFRRAPL